MQASWCFGPKSSLPACIISEVRGESLLNINQLSCASIPSSTLFRVTCYSTKETPEEAKVCFSEVQDSEWAVRPSFCLKNHGHNIFVVTNNHWSLSQIQQFQCHPPALFLLSVYLFIWSSKCHVLFHATFQLPGLVNISWLPKY